MLSIHTNPRWGCSFGLVRKARTLTQKLILAKGIHTNDSDIEKAIEAGVNYVLVVGRIPVLYQTNCLLEPLYLDEITSYTSNATVVWNSRDLTALPAEAFKKETIDDVRKIWKGHLVQVSNLKTKADIRPLADAVLVGTNLIEFLNSLR